MKVCGFYPTSRHIVVIAHSARAPSAQAAARPAMEGNSHG